MRNITIWLKAFRLRTLPLALSCVLMGTFLAAAEGSFQWRVFLLTLLTTLLLQILSNLANDFGDADNGADNEMRVGPTRVTHTGLISRKAMISMIVLFSVAAILSGVLLIVVALRDAPAKFRWLFLLLGLLSVAAAWKYTMGKRPYGYRGLGDLFVFLFFGLLGVWGSYFMQRVAFHGTLLLPAAAIGFFSTGVLNLNNLRDEESDRRAGKNTLVTMKGALFAKRYHTLLILGGIVLAFLYNLLSFRGYLNFLWLLMTPLFLAGLLRVWRAQTASGLIAELQRLAMATFLFSLTYGISLLL
ncbi:MAG: 1,4-dihydroxy-2-naphthoate octaprenyltransferase [Bacteroidetes bacterium]|nr:MAG: 1,4-dihydroxy-2-naphthoate octaprenyltransferase [Bacteroidota bacterium]